MARRTRATVPGFAWRRSDLIDDIKWPLVSRVTAGNFLGPDSVADAFFS